ncbi:MAG: F0F1 ATP synthase subunit delta [Dehalococcoidia bacterium]|nr:F0F1 ATP synthase subunit delta [Dehalococcoidia bacterium]MSQ17065.1 F0F1 ATP synthase subunit delta [Dehalococcoidia bacterium]
MPKRVSGKRYAQALFDLAVEHNQADQWAESLQVATEAVQDDQFRALLTHAQVPVADRIGAVNQVLEGQPVLVRNLVALLVSRGMVNLMPQVQAGYQMLLDEYRGRQQVEVTSAVRLTVRDQHQISRFVHGLINREVVLTSKVDPEILGGVIIQIGDQLLDGSTRARLEGLRKQVRSHVAAPAG